MWIHFFSFLVLIAFSQVAHASTAFTKLFSNPVISEQCKKSVIPMRRYNGYQTLWSSVESFQNDKRTELFFSRVSKEGQTYLFRINSPGLSTKTTVQTKITDLIATEQYLYALSKETLMAFDTQSLDRLWEAKTHKLRRPLKSHESARGMAMWNGLIIIAHGEQGIKFFDPDQQKLVDYMSINVPQRPGHRSMASDVDVRENRAVVVMDDVTINDTGRGYEGFVFIDLPARKMLWHKSINFHREGLGLPQVTWEKDHLLVNNLGLIFKYSVSDIQDSRYATPNVRIWDYPYRGSISGRPLYTKSHVLSCFHEVFIPRGGNPEGSGRSIILKRENFNL